MVEVRSFKIPSIWLHARGRGVHTLGTNATSCKRYRGMRAQSTQLSVRNRSEGHVSLGIMSWDIGISDVLWGYGLYTPQAKYPSYEC